MPPPTAPPVAAATPLAGATAPDSNASAPATVGDTPAALESLLAACGVTDDGAALRASNGDLTGLPQRAILAVARWYADSCGLPHSDVAVIDLRGKLTPYVKASGVMRYARDKYKSIDHETPVTISNGTYIVVFATVVLSDGRSVRDFACRRLTDHNSVMACSTAATVRALRIAVGIPIPSEGEL